jgi:hypothetical protein
MADKNTAQTTGTTTTTEAPKKEKKVKVKLPSTFSSAKAAQDAAADRDKGPRRAFTCTYGDREIHVVANNEGRAGGIAFGEIGGKVAEVGKVKKTKAPVGITGIMEAVGQLPEADRATVMTQLKALLNAGGKSGK